MLSLAHRISYGGHRLDRPVLDRSDVVAADHGSASPFVNMAVLLRPLIGDPDDAPALTALRDFFPPGRPWLLISAWPTPDLTPTFALVGHPPFMARPPGPLAPIGAGDDVVVTEVVDDVGFEALERVLVDGYPVPELQPAKRGCLGDGRLLGGPSRWWLAWDGGRPVACAAAHLAAGVAQVEYVATLASARGGGFGTAVTRAATLADPARPAVLIASDLGRPVYERLGYLALDRWTLWASLA